MQEMDGNTIFLDFCVNRSYSERGNELNPVVFIVFKEQEQKNS